MYDRVDAGKFDDLFLPLSRRSAPGVYFVRVCGWNKAVRAGVWRYHEAARQRGVVLEGPLPNPDEGQLSYLSDVLGTDFEPGEAFLVRALEKWLPRLAGDRRRALARGLSAQFDELRYRGKPESVLRNVYIKVMCWLHYRFERMLPLLGENDLPRILFSCDGLTAHELMLLRLLSGLGADVMLLEPAGDGAYLKRDPQSRFSQLLVPEGEPFPEGFSLKQLRREMAAPPAPPPTPAAPKVRPAPKPAQSPCTNAWMKTADYHEILTPIASRGDDHALFYNAFIRVRGVVDKLTYLGELHQFYQRLQATGRKIAIVDEGLTRPGQEEISRLRRREYHSAEELIADLSANLPGSGSMELKRMMRYAYEQALTSAQCAEMPLNRLLTAAVYLLCWIRRYHEALFGGYRAGDTPCLVLMGGCRNVYESLYPIYLAWLPADVLILAPDLNRPCQLQDARLLELTGEETLPTPRFPRDAGSLQVRTVAAHAEEDMTNALFGESGLFRARQFSRGVAMTLQTTYDELFILWEQELKYRPGFDTVEQTVTMPVLYAKVSGVEGGNVAEYWQQLKRLTGKDTFLVRHMPIREKPGNPYLPLALNAFYNGRLRREAIKAHADYPFGLLRGEIQEHIFDKMQLMLDRRLIKGTFEKGTEYAIVSTVLNMDKALLRMLQGFDFTRANPKVVCIAAEERGATLEDAILLTFLNLAGFDVALFVPTGYQSIERFLNDNYPVEHQAGEYLYDLTVPDLDALPQPKGPSWLRNLWKRGN